MAIPAEQQQHRDDFGKAICAWMRICNFSQQTIHNMALCLKTEGPWGSQVSLVQRGKHDPKAQFWVAWGVLNKAIEAGDKSVFGSKHLYAEDGKALIRNPESASRQIQERLSYAKPFLTEHDKPATAADFFAIFIGELKPSAIYEQPIQLSDSDAEQLTQQYRDAFRKLAVSEMITPKEAWANIEPVCRELNMKTAQIQHFREVLIGLAEYTADQLNELSTNPAEKPAPGKALDMAS